MVFCFEQVLEKSIQLSGFNVTVTCDYELKVNLSRMLLRDFLYRNQPRHKMNRCGKTICRVIVYSFFRIVFYVARFMA